MTTFTAQVDTPIQECLGCTAGPAWPCVRKAGRTSALCYIPHSCVKWGAISLSSPHASRFDTAQCTLGSNFPHTVTFMWKQSWTLLFRGDLSDGQNPLAGLKAPWPCFLKQVSEPPNLTTLLWIFFISCSWAFWATISSPIKYISYVLDKYNIFGSFFL